MILLKSTHYRLLQAALDQLRELHRIEMENKVSLHRLELHAKEEKCIELRAALIRAKKQRDEARAKLAEAEAKPHRYQSGTPEPEDPNLKVYKRLTQEEQFNVDGMRNDLQQLKAQAEALRNAAANGDATAKANYQGAERVYAEALQMYGPELQRYGIQYQT